MSGPLRPSRHGDLSGLSVAVMLALPLGVFVIVSGLAWAAGAANLGLAATFGVLAFAVTTVAVLLRAAPPPDDRG